ncbi:D-alanine-D-alanine ligase [Rhodobium orientis]|uniref:D-alanine--D-alanine ligase n=1 Tax=Rhodobium orientis TaxID=34017 RepID=A0A327JHT6_9HYPH|nr:D-alanine--D-alanine ligase [Rhodobium orientis]MBB4305458.1 D-alanine-D-alanine ligase [Rhodobium orientis]MBK5948654.1 D-alanine--D-alanine ligase [Rhodobium orientis]RAI25276.1 D-alanine--D-alanine ligase [Rhodobium orientis]
MANQKHVAVLMGGWAAERYVSLDTGAGCAGALERAGYRVTRIDVDRNISAVLAELKPDVAFNALHGPFGEDGCIQGILEYLDIPYTHSGVLASALAMNKEKAKHILKAAGVPLAEHKVMHRLEAAKGHPMKTPYVVKPVTEGSSYGVLIVGEGAEHPPQELYRDDWPYGDMVMVERYIPGRELTCAVMGDVALGVIDIVPVGLDFYDYDAKYRPGGSKHILPAEISPNIYQSIQNLSLKAHKALGCRGVSRADFRYDDRLHGTGELICLEVNTQPGMTATSLVPEMAAHAGHSFEELVAWMVEDASCGR